MARGVLILTGTMFLLCCRPAASSGEKERLRISVETVEAFIEAIGPDRTILLQPGDTIEGIVEELRGMDRARTTAGTGKLAGDSHSPRSIRRTLSGKAELRV